MNRPLQLYPRPIKTENIHIITEDADLSPLVAVFLETRKSFESKNLLASWKPYYQALRSLFFFYNGIPLDQRRKIAVTSGNHAFTWIIRREQKWYEIDLGFEFTCALVSGILLFIDDAVRSGTMTSAQRNLGSCVQVVGDLIFMIDTVCRERDCELPPVIQTKSIHSVCSLAYALGQVSHFFLLMESLPMPQSYNESSLNDFASTHFDSILAVYLGVFSAREIFLRSVAHLKGRVAATLDECMIDYISFRYDEARAIVNFLNLFVISIDRSKLSESMPLAVQKFECLFERNVAVLPITSSIWSLVGQHQEVVVKRSKDVRFKKLESQGRMLCPYANVDEYISKNRIDPIICIVSNVTKENP